MTKHTWCPGIWGVTLGLLAALAAWPQPASAQLSGSGMTITAHLQGGPFFADIVVGPEVELPDGDGRLGGYPRKGESVDCENFKCVFTFSPAGLIGPFELTGLNSPIERELLEITISGTLVASSDSHVSAGNEEGGSFARFTVDCNPFLAVNPCLGGTVEVNFVFAPPGGGDAGDPLQALNDLIAAVIAQNLSGTGDLIENLEDAQNKIENGKPDKAINKLNKFIDGVRNKQAKGKIGDAVAESMIFTAGDIITSLQTA